MADGDFKVKNGLQVGGKADIVYDTDLSLGSSGVVYAGTATPSSPAVGDIWIDNSTNGNFSNYFRWRKTAVGGETSLSGLDDFGISLSYLAGNEQLYINGVLQYRGSDYNATNGTTITGITALSPSDIIDIISVNSTTLEQLTLYSSTAPTSPQAGTLWVDTSQVVNDTAQYLDYTSTTGFKNKIINGDFRIWQRGATFTSPSGVYVADRWNTSQSGGTATTSVARTAFPLGIASTIGVEADYFLKSTMTATSTTTRYSVSQRIEDVKTFSGQTVVASFWARADSNRATNVYLLQNFGTGGSSQVAAGLLVANLTTSWQKFTFSVTIPSVSGKTIGTDSNLELRFDQVVAVGSVLDLWGVQLEAGTIATSFENRPIGTELALCQRYFYRVTPTVDGQWLSTFGTGRSTTEVQVPIPLPVTMRDIPTYTGSQLAVADTLNGRIAAATGAITGSTTPNIAVLTLGVTGATVYRPYVLINNTGQIGTSFMSFEAEL